MARDKPLDQYLSLLSLLFSESKAIPLTIIIFIYMNIFECWNESSEFPLFLMGKFALITSTFLERIMLANQGTTVLNWILLSTFVPKLTLVTDSANINNKFSAKACDQVY
jgi:hypothetical protein